MTSDVKDMTRQINPYEDLYIYLVRGTVSEGLKRFGAEMVLPVQVSLQNKIKNKKSAFLILL